VVAKHKPDSSTLILVNQVEIKGLWTSTPSQRKAAIWISGGSFKLVEGKRISGAGLPAASWLNNRAEGLEFQIECKFLLNRVG
jgi:hypothetical protein